MCVIYILGKWLCDHVIDLESGNLSFPTAKAKNNVPYHRCRCHMRVTQGASVGKHLVFVVHCAVHCISMICKVCNCTWIHMNIHVLICDRILYIYIYIYIQLYTYIHTHTYHTNIHDTKQTITHTCTENSRHSPRPIATAILQTGHSRGWNSGHSSPGMFSTPTREFGLAALKWIIAHSKHTWNIKFYKNIFWLVVWTPLKNMKVSWDYSQYMETHVPNHQPVFEFCFFV